MPVPDDQVATLTYLAEGEESDYGSRASFQHPVWVTRIDGKDHLQLCKSSGQELSWFDQHNRRESLWMLPAGEHTVQVGELPEYAKATLYIANRHGLETMLEDYQQVCVDGGEDCIVTGSWELTFLTEPGHAYAIGVEVQESIQVTRDETGEVLFLVGSPPWPPGVDWSSTGEELAARMSSCSNDLGCMVKLMEENEIAISRPGPFGLQLRRIRPFLQDLTTGARIGTFEAVESGRE